MNMKCFYFDSQLTIWGLNRNYCSFFMLKTLFHVKNYFRIKKRRRQKLLFFFLVWAISPPIGEHDVVNKPGTLEMREYVSSADINMILMAITKAQQLSFDSWKKRFPYALLEHFTLIKALFLLINRFYLSSFFSLTF